MGMSDKEFEDLRATRLARKTAAESAKAERVREDLVKLNELEMTHGDDRVMPVYTAGGMVVIGVPGEVAMQRWREALWCDKTKAGERSAVKARAASQLANTCILYPEPSAYKAMVAAFPGIGDTVGAAAVKFAGVAEEEEAGKQ